ncbi:MucR family transcriptional regulator [Azorhizobium sp. AG788]|uniref:MucR family transcriptional regulator n=1 Tax=Azorhizobium sp. AG788 TaxID=2183897 RepID=UPI00106050B0|nr:MucR family transcriptional regulator [Azorhizobium sp. AG788]TDT99131.1 MucR family transcriptional regulator [Azorhizobium sp. AG788]
MSELKNALFVELTAQVVADYVGNNSVAAADLPQLIQNVYSTFNGLNGQPALEIVTELTPAVPVKKSVTPDFIVCLEDGKKFKSLRRHLKASYDLTPEAYRAKWGLPPTYPMVAQNYANARSALAKQLGLGRKPAPDPEPLPRPKQATRRKKAPA